MKPRIERSVAAPAAAPTAVARDYAPLTTARPVMRPFLAPLSERAVARLVVEQPATSSVEVAPQQEVDVARAPAPALPAFGASASEPSRSAFDSFLNSLQQPEAQQPPRQLGLIEQPRTSRDALAETWSIGVYR